MNSNGKLAYTRGGVSLKTGCMCCYSFKLAVSIRSFVCFVGGRNVGSLSTPFLDAE